MAKIYAQGYEPVLIYSGSLAAQANISGSMVCPGYQRLVGMIYSDASAGIAAACGLVIQQSANYGTSYRAITASYAMTACTMVSVNQVIYGNAVKVAFYNGSACAASALDAFFALYPI
jgi:hypothetical protein